MKYTATEETMEMRRIERLDRLNFFMRSDRVPAGAGRLFSLGATHHLLTGFFQNSHWRTAWYCLKAAAANSWMEFSVTCRMFWYRRILKLNEEQIDDRF
jgi:hypothetical protein